MSAIRGVRIGTAAAGIKRRDRDDITLFELQPGGQCAAVFTRNAFRAAPVDVAAEHLQQGEVRYLLINAGNANAGTGQQGLADARASCEAVGSLAVCKSHQVMPFSTGVIGEPLPLEKITGALPDALASLSEDGWERASRAIMTTDTRPKLATRSVEIEGITVHVTGISKGAGMIEPNMATMLAYLATDAPVSAGVLQQCLSQAVESSFNSISVDGDTSTNDSCVLMASGSAPITMIDSTATDAYAALQQVVTEVCIELAQAIVRDGEGATKFITLQVTGGKDCAEARRVGKTVANSPLVKTAFFASDPNWGRILAAIGRAGLSDLDITAITIHLGDVCIVRNGGRAADYSEQLAQEVMNKPEITVSISLGRGDALATVWTCDFSYDYVRINAEYRT